MEKTFELKPEFIIFNTGCKDWQEAIVKSSDPLLKYGYITEQYQQAMIDSVIEHGPYIVITPHIAMPHARPEMGSKDVGYSILRLETPVSFSDEEIHQVRLLIALSCKDENTHVEILQTIAIVLSNEDKLNTIMTCKDKADIVQLFREAFNE